jgi:hypothetical protein
MDLNELSQKMVPPAENQLLWEIYCAFTHAGRDEPHQTIGRLVKALQLLVNQHNFLSVTPGLDSLNETGAMVARSLLPPVPGVVTIRKRRKALDAHLPTQSHEKGAQK